MELQRQLHEKFCSSCGNTILKEAEICPKCGVRQMNFSNSITNNKSKIVAGILALFFGGIGFHKFYMNKTGIGLLYLIFCWTFIPAFVAFFEALIYLTESDESFSKRIS